MNEFLIDTAFVNKVIEGAKLQGVDCGPILLNNGISELALNQKGKHVRLKSFAALSLEVMQKLNDEFLGLAHKPQPLGSFNTMCRSVISARNLERSIKRCAHFWNLFDNTYHHHIETKNNFVAYVLTPLPDQPAVSNYLIEAILSSIHRYHCWLGGQFIELEEVCVEYLKPNYAAAYKTLFYGSQIRYGQSDSRLVFSKRALDMEIVQTPETLDKYLRGNNLSLLYQPKNYRVIGDQVRQWLEKNMQQGNYLASLSQAAKHFQMSQQVLHRRLQAEGLSFKEIKMQTRRDKAINLLFTNKYKIEEISTNVGFSEPSAFIRAFKNWTGLTPLAYRNQHK